MMKPVAGEAKMNKAAESEPKSGHMKAAGPKGMSSDVGGESKADMKGALMGDPTDGNPLRGATKELHDQHPHSYSDHGPHHGGSEHIRHMPLHGMKPSKGYGR